MEFKDKWIKDLVVMEDRFERLPLRWREKDAMRCMMRWLDLLQRTWIRHWIGCWTFLWLYRDWTFIPHDLDIDISASLDWNDYKEWEEKIMDIFKDWRLIRTIHYKWRPFQIAFIDERKVIFDITFYYTGIKEWKLVSYSDCWTVTESAELFKWFIPSPSEQYLEERYWDWRTPTWTQDPRNFNCNSLNPIIEECET